MSNKTVCKVIKNNMLLNFVYTFQLQSQNILRATIAAISAHTSEHMVQSQQYTMQEQKFTSWQLYGPCASLLHLTSCAKCCGKLKGSADLLSFQHNLTVSDIWRGTTWLGAHQKALKTIICVHMSCGGKGKPQRKPPNSNQGGRRNIYKPQNL